MSLRKFTLRARIATFATVCLLASPGCALFWLETPIDRTAPEQRCERNAPHSGAARGWFRRVFIIVLENQKFKAVRSHSFFWKLAKEGRLLSNFHGLFHPSYSNYLAMVSGRRIKTWSDHKIDIPGPKWPGDQVPTIGDQLKFRNLEFRNYAEGLPEKLDGGCPYEVNEAREWRYVRRHVPFLSFRQHQCDGCPNIVDAARLFDDLEKDAVPPYAFYSPDLDADGHDPKFPSSIGVAKGAVFVQRLLGLLRRHRSFWEETLVVVTYDESSFSVFPDDNHIYTVLLGGPVKPGDPDSRPFNHYNVLRTIEENFGIPPLGDGDRCAAPIDGVFWKS